MNNTELTPPDDLYAAKLAALKVVAFAVLDVHPEKARLASHMTLVADFLMAQWLNSEAVSDSFAAVFQREMEFFQKRLVSPSEDRLPP